MVLPSSTFSGAPCIYLSRAGGDGERRLDREKGGSKAGKNGEKGRERGTPCPTSNKLVIIFSQYLSWIGCYFIIFYCLLLLLLPVRKPPSVSPLASYPPPPIRHPPGPLSSPFDHRRRPALFYYLEPLSAPREFTRGTHYWGVYSAVTVALATRLSPFFLLLCSSLPSFLTCNVKRIIREPVCQRGVCILQIFAIISFTHKL